VDDVLLALVAGDRVRRALDLADAAADARIRDEMGHKPRCGNPLRAAIQAATVSQTAGRPLPGRPEHSALECVRKMGETFAMKEVRAVVLGLVVVLVIAMVFAFWNRPAKEFTRIKEFKVEVRQREGDATRRLSFKVPTTLISRIAKLSHLDSVDGGHLVTDWGNGDVTQDI